MFMYTFIQETNLHEVLVAAVHFFLLPLFCLLLLFFLCNLISEELLQLFGLLIGSLCLFLLCLVELCNREKENRLLNGSGILSYAPSNHVLFYFVT